MLQREFKFGLRARQLVNASEWLCAERLGSPVLLSYLVQLDFQPFRSLSGRAPLTGGGLAGSGPGFGCLPGSEEVLILGGTPEARLPPSWWGKCVINA